MKKLWHRAGLVGFAIVFVTLAGFVWNEAKKEIVFLCANFTPGVTEQSVLRQLDTGHFLRYELQYEREQLNAVSRITAHSLFNFSLYTCEIQLDQRGQVVTAKVL